MMYLGLVMATSMVACSVLGIAGSGSKIMITLTLIIALIFFTFDTHLVINSQYGPIKPDDTVYASMKLFTDFILILTLLFRANS